MRTYISRYSTMDKQYRSIVGETTFKNGTECSTLTNNLLSLHAIKWKRKGVIKGMNESRKFLFVFFPYLFALFIRSLVRSFGYSSIRLLLVFTTVCVLVHVCCIQSDNFSFGACRLCHMASVFHASRSFHDVPIIRCNYLDVSVCSFCMELILPH